MSYKRRNMIFRRIQIGTLAVFCFLSLGSILACRSTSPGVSSTSFNGYSIAVSPGCQNSKGHSESYSDGKNNEVLSYEFRCGGNIVLIRGSELIVNGASYGPLVKGAKVAVDNGKVLVNTKEVQGTASRL
jgi:hypothetical protein